MMIMRYLSCNLDDDIDDDNRAINLSHDDRAIPA